MTDEAGRADKAGAAVRVAWVVMVVACGGGGEPGPVPQIEGLYTGTWSIAVEDDHADCPAALTVSDQVDSVFATRFEILRRDGDGVGCIDTIQTGTGIVRANGTITALAESVEPVTCVLEGPNRGLSGTLVDDSLDLSGQYTYQCSLEYTWTMRFSGSARGAPLPSYPDIRGSYTGTWATLAQGIVVTCPVTVTVSDQVRDDLSASYTLGAVGGCIAQPTEVLSGTITVDGAVSVTGRPPVSPGCTVERGLALAGTAEGNEISLLGAFALRCGGTVREFEVSVGVERDEAG